MYNKPERAPPRMKTAAFYSRDRGSVYWVVSGLGGIGTAAAEPGSSGVGPTSQSDSSARAGRFSPSVTKSPTGKPDPGVFTFFGLKGRDIVARGGAFFA